VELRHEPALTVDGIVDGRRLGEIAEREAAAVTGVLDDSRFDEIRVAVDGDVITVHAELRGGLPDGRAVSLPTHMRCVVSDGRIVAITHVMGPQAMGAWAEVAVAGGHLGAEALLGDGEPGPRSESGASPA
jgi:hypothetical protein